MPLLNQNSIPCLHQDASAAASVSIYSLILSLEKSKEFAYQGIKVNIPSFKRYFFNYLPPKKQWGAERLCMNISTNLNTTMQRCINFLFQNKSLPYLFFKLYFKPQVRISQIVYDYVVDYHLCLSGLIWTIHSFMFI